MLAPDAYLCESYEADGTVHVQGSDLRGRRKVVLRPRGQLPRHELVGVPLVRRFGRGFVRGLGGGLREYVQCIVTDDCRIYVRSTDGGVIVTPPDFELYL